MKTLTIEEVAEALKCHAQTVYALARAGEIQGKRVGRRWVFTEAAVQRYLERPEEAECPSSSTRNRPTITSGSPRRTADEYFKALGLPAGGQQKSTKPRLKVVSGANTG